MKTWMTFMMALWMMAVTLDAKEWETNFAEAQTKAKEEGRYLLLDFSGSDWCGWCIKLEEEVFNKGEFKAFAREKLVCVLVDFPQMKSQPSSVKKQNKELAQKYSIEGYPSVILLSPKGEVAGRTGYQEGGPKSYVEHLKRMISDYEKKMAK